MKGPLTCITNSLITLLKISKYSILCTEWSQNSLAWLSRHFHYFSSIICNISTEKIYQIYLAFKTFLPWHPYLLEHYKIELQIHSHYCLDRQKNCVFLFFSFLLFLTVFINVQAFFTSSQNIGIGKNTLVLLVSIQPDEMTLKALSSSQGLFGALMINLSDDHVLALTHVLSGG